MKGRGDPLERAAHELRVKREVRTQDMADRRRAGATLEEIGAIHEVSAQRVHQILATREGRKALAGWSQGSQERRDDGRFAAQELEEYQILANAAMTDTLGVAPLPRELEGTTTRTWEAVQMTCWATGVLVSGAWRGQTVQGILTAGHVAERIKSNEGVGVFVLGRQRGKANRAPACIRALDITVIKGERLRIKGHRDVFLDDIGWIDIGPDGVELIRSTLQCVGYNPERNRRPIEGEGTAKALCAAGNVEQEKIESRAMTPPEAVRAIYAYEEGTMIGRKGTGRKVGRQAYLAEIEHMEGDVRGMSGAGIWVQCDPRDGGRALLGIVGSYLRDWPEAGKDKVLFMPVEGALNRVMGRVEPKRYWALGVMWLKMVIAVSRERPGRGGVSKLARTLEKYRGQAPDKVIAAVSEWDIDDETAMVGLATLRALSAELFLKSMVEASGRTVPHTHDLSRLFEMLGASTQADIQEEYERRLSFLQMAREQLKHEPVTDISALLEKHKDDFKANRYPMGEVAYDDIPEMLTACFALEATTTTRFGLEPGTRNAAERALLAHSEGAQAKELEAIARTEIWVAFGEDLRQHGLPFQ